VVIEGEALQGEEDKVATAGVRGSRVEENRNKGFDSLNPSSLGMEVDDDNNLISRRRLNHLVLRGWVVASMATKVALNVSELTFLLPGESHCTLMFACINHNRLGCLKHCRECGVGNCDIVGGMIDCSGTTERGSSKAKRRG
jgi:hypothetical protein